MIKDARNKATESKWDGIIKEEDKDDWEVSLGRMIKGVASPSVLLGAPGAVRTAYNVGKPLVKAAIAAGAAGLWAAEYSALRQYAEQNNINFKTLLAETSVGALFGVGLLGLGAGGMMVARGATGRIKSFLNRRAATASERADIAAVARRGTPVANMTKKEAKKVYAQIEEEILDLWAKRQNRAFEGGPDSPAWAEHLDEASEAMDVGVELSAKFPEVFQDQASINAFQDKVGMVLPNTSSEVAMNKASWWNDGELEGWRNNMRTALGWADYGIGNLDTTIRNISEQLFGRWRRADIKVNLLQADMHKRMVAFEGAISDLPKEMQERIWWNNLFDQNFDPLLNHTNPKIASAAKDLIDGLDQIGDSLLANRVINQKVEGHYFPRLVDDVDGWLASLERKPRSDADEILKKAYIDLNKKYNPHTKEWGQVENPRDLTRYEQRKILGESGIGVNLDYAIPTSKKRFFWGKVPDEQIEFYKHPKSAFFNYVRDSSEAIAAREFFGVATGPDYLIKAGTQRLDIDQAIEYVVNETTQRTGRASRVAKHRVGSDLFQREEFNTINRILKARFDPANVQQSDFLRGLQDVVYMTLLGQGSAALTQVADAPGIGAFTMGMGNIIKATYQTAKIGLTKKARQTFDSEIDGGISDAIYEINSKAADDGKNWLGKQVRAGASKSMEWAQFKRIDKVGKRIVSNAALLKGMASLKTPKGMKEFYNKYSGAFGDEWVNEVMTDLARMEKLPLGERNEGMTYAILEYTMMELADAQPITKGQMPLWRMEHPRASLPLALMSYSLKVMDRARTDILQQMAQGNHREAAKQATRFAIQIGGSATAMGMVKDWLQGKDMSTDEVLAKWAWNVSDQFMMDEYTWNQIVVTHDMGQAWEGVTDVSGLGFISDVLFMMKANAVNGISDTYDPDKVRNQEAAAKANNEMLQKLPVLGKWVFGNNRFWNPPDEENLEREKERIRNMGN